MIRCGVVGATGYTGIELIKILLRHSGVNLTELTTRKTQPFSVRTLVPGLPEDIGLQVRPFSFDRIKRNVDVAFLCLPHTEAMSTAARLRRAGKTVIDLSADFRIKSPNVYEKWYQKKHRAVHLLKEAVYGLPELNRKHIQKADLIANPGCYPTGAILGIAPLLGKDLIERESIIIDSKSGVSGAGRKPTTATQFCEVNENFYAYRVNRHQHTPEIEQVLSDVAGNGVRVNFVPHLLPVQRGILSTIYLDLKKKVRANVIKEAYKEAYAAEPFVRVRGENVFPALADVRGTNFCDIGYNVDLRAGRVIVITAIDNLIKGASGQAVQNMNIRMGFEEDEGLRTW
ncbi:MAG: N-acetyl-gamma-glutamyl-phosphate reductase [Candidatus Omnitrophota bacterium]|nr:N-acetyl-gamma-glutamyl-phosphate reductase [Candidatus Omnitrophota bacterium]